LMVRDIGKDGDNVLRVLKHTNNHEDSPGICHMHVCKYNCEVGIWGRSIKVQFDEVAIGDEGVP
jgi:hypothetical protein